MSHLKPILGGMLEKVVSIDAFRASKLVDRTTTRAPRALADVRPDLSRRSIEHRERMLRFLRAAALERSGREVQGRLLL